ncbi:hypothetical protein [Natronolimnohabitans innermongolicus]|uniref:Uncharacterized protein n=1 Tax=Natronolimnohabitans innermongolicus JCM 12255 TaxID=1227499 RepID=L9X7S2_9EURY|nr:hypothetical protein [Natronolimnohabitans innermongolicus]ELY56673.1 hypothetical protein C493_09875 [Natronolimnohabitans innermongolicus JCM 12255]
MKPTFEPTDDGLEIIDPIERHRYRLTTESTVTPESVETARIPFPVDDAVSITTDQIRLPSSDLVYVLDESGQLRTEVRPAEQETLPAGEHLLDISGPIKLYANVEGTVHIYSDIEHTYLSFDGQQPVVLGARSFHTRPAETIVTSAEPTDVMQAVTAFGSALKTMTPERSYSTLRGHPPELRLGDDLHVPDGLSKRETGVRLEIPPTLSHVCTVTPLAYYLGADVVPGAKPRLTTSTGFERVLGRDTTFEEAVSRTLKQTFFLDCIVRTAGTTPLPLHERRKLEPNLPFDIEAVYDRSLAERLESYFQVSFESIRSSLPNWHLEVRLEPVDDVIEFLPFVANDLPLVSIEDAATTTGPSTQQQTQAIDDFIRGDTSQTSTAVRNASRTDPTSSRGERTTIQQSWQVDNTSEITSTTPLSAYHNGIGREPRNGPIEIKVVCNDQSMHEELETVNGVYGTREELPFDVTTYYDLTKAEFESVLASESDFLHYIGHIDDDGFQCADGKLDGARIESTDTKAFFLNACQSYEQGLHLVDAGSIGGIVTLDDVVNSGAVSVGSTIARLLNRGFPLYAALDIARKDNIIGEQYRIVGNGITTVTQSKTGGPSMCTLTSEGARQRISVYTYITLWLGRGGVFTPHVDSVDEYFLCPGAATDLTVSDETLEEYLKMEQIPVVTDDGLYWSRSLVDSSRHS